MNDLYHIEPEISFFPTISVTLSLCNRRPKAENFSSAQNEMFVLAAVSGYCRANKYRQLHSEIMKIATVSGLKNYALRTEQDWQNKFFEPTGDRMN